MTEMDSYFMTWNLTSANNTMAPTLSQEKDPAMAELERVVAIVVPVIFGIIVAVGFIGNLLVILVVIVNQHMRNTMNILILNLALSDMLFIVICVPFTAMNTTMHLWPFGEGWCKVYQYTTHVSVYASAYTLMLISFVRYLAIVHPLSVGSREFRRKRHIITSILMIWTVILGSNIPLLFEYQVYEYRLRGEERSNCFNIKEVLDADHGKIFYGCFFVFGWLLPMAIITILYALVVRGLRRSRLCSTSSTACRVDGVVHVHSTANPHTDSQITRMLVVVMVVFGLCWLPFHALQITQYFGSLMWMGPTEGMVIVTTSRCLAYMNSCLNPLLYTFLSASFRKSFYEVIRC